MSADVSGQEPKYKYLDKIDSPADLHKLSPEQLPDVCADIRRFLIEALSKNPGHFASSMGAVELTVALHYVFDTPADRLVWDVGHQAYGHKILTGRREQFDTNRKLGGLCGFPTPLESDYDTFSAGHASNSISAALGMAIASRLKGEDPQRHVVAVIGDASISGGLAFEGMNNAANTPNNLLIVLNDNNMSIDSNVGSLHTYMSHLNTSRKYNSVRYKAYRALKKVGLVNDSRRGLLLRFNNAVKALLSGSQNIFEGLNIRYFGPYDGHDVQKLVKVLEGVKDMEGPRILHLRTVKGKGYEPAEKDPMHWHAPGKFNAVTGVRSTGVTAGKPLKYQDVFGRTLLELALDDPKIVAVTAAMPSGTSISMMQTVLPERVFDVGISEGHAVTFAGGLAKEGMRPVVGIYSCFLQRAYDHIIHDVALLQLPVTFAIDRAGLVGEDGMTHHGALDLAYLRTVPNLTVAAPRNEHALRNLLYTAQSQTDGPWAIRYPRGSGKNPDWKNQMTRLERGSGEALREGDAAVVLTIGTIADNAAEAIERLDTEGLQVAHYDMIFVKPLDEELLRKAASKGVPIITVEDGTVEGGMGSAVAEWLEDNNINVPLTRVGIPDKFIAHGTVAELQAQCGLAAQSIYRTVRQAVDKAHKS